MEINNETIQLFNQDHSILFKDLMMVKDANYLLNGSFPITFFSSDIDLYTKLDLADYNLLLTEIFNFLIDMDSNTFFLEMKIGKTKAKTVKSAIKMIVKELRTVKNVYLDPKQWVKMDLIILINGYYEEVTIIYDFGDSVFGKSKDEMTSELIDDALNNYQNGKYYKVLKRLREIYRRTDHKTDLDRIEKMLDDDVGFLYLTNARLEALKNVKDNAKHKNKVMRNIKEDVMVRLMNMFDMKIK